MRPIAFLSLCLTLAAGVAFAAPPAPVATPEPPAPKQADDARQAQARAAILRKTGGFLTAPATGPGVLVADLQSGPHTAAVAAVALDLGKTTMLPFRYAPLKPGASLWKSAAAALAQKDAAFAVLVIDDPEAPALLAAPEARWAAVNVAPLKVGADAATAAKRIRQEVWRAACLALGAADSVTPMCVMGPVSEAKDLDKLGPAANPDYLNKMLRRAGAAGIKPQRPVSYRKAVEDGWAPPPANPLQQAIWDEVRGGAKKE
jgi:hypothetical protein